MRSDLTKDFTALKPHGPTLTILGSGVGIPQVDRNAPGLLLTDMNNPLYFLIDCGSGIPRQIVRSGVQCNKISHLFLSHLHADHAAGVPALFQAFALDPPLHSLQIFGPFGTSAFCKTMVQTFFPYLEDHITFEVTEVAEGSVVAGLNWQVTCTKVTHFTVEALAYRFEIDGKVCVYSGDTAPCENLNHLATGADLLVHECSHLDDAPPELLQGHSTPSQVAELARTSNVKKLCLTHFYPEVAERIDEVAQQVRTTFRGEVIIACDLLQLAF